MKTFFTAVRQFAQDERGVTAIEYGLIAALIAGGIAVAVGTAKDAISTAFTFIAGKVTAATT